MKEVESSNRQLVENMEQVSSIVETMTTCISDSDETSKRMLSKYEESASNINNIENVIQELMCELGIGGFMGLDDIHAGMKAKVILPKHLERMEYHGEVRSVAENSISLILSDNPQLNGSETCKVQVTVDNVLYCWDQAQIQADTASGSHAYALQLSARPEIKNRRKYPRADVSNPCTITLKDSDTTFSGQLDNISANGFAFLIRNPFSWITNMQMLLSISKILPFRISPIWKDMSSGARMMKVYILWDVRCRKTIMQYAIM